MARKKSRPGKPGLVKATLRWVLATLGGAAVLVAALLAFQGIENFFIEDPRFRLGSPEEYGDAGPEIRVRGDVHTSRARVMEVFSSDNGRSVYMLPVTDRRRELLALDWVKNASVARIWPNSVEVRIEERQPVAFVELPPRSRGVAFRVALIDEDGVILEQPPRSQYDLPVLTGIREEHSEATRAVRVRRMQLLLEAIGELGDQISEIDVSEPDNLKVTQNIDGKAVVLILGGENYLARLRNFLQHYPEIRRRLPEATTFDLRLDDRITAMDGVGNGG